MQVSVVTPEKKVFEGSSEDILLQSTEGQLNILEGHANLVTTVAEGPVVIKTSSGSEEFSVGNGVLKVEENAVSILVESVQ